MTSKSFNLLGYFLYLMLKPAIWLWFRLSRHERVRTVVTNQDDEVLLIRGWISDQLWDLPGGGIKYGENASQAASRELYEETGLKISARKFKLAGSFLHTNATTPFKVVLLTASSDTVGELKPKRITEIIEVAWWPKNGLPEQKNSLVESSLHKLRLV